MSEKEFICLKCVAVLKYKPLIREYKGRFYKRIPTAYFCRIKKKTINNLDKQKCDLMGTKKLGEF